MTGPLYSWDLWPLSAIAPADQAALDLMSDIARSQPYRPPPPARSQPMEPAMGTKCGKCGQPIHPSESGVRHFGTFRAHAEYRCISILNARAEAAEAEVKRLRDVLAGIRDYDDPNLPASNKFQAIRNTAFRAIDPEKVG